MTKCGECGWRQERCDEMPQLCCGGCTHIVRPNLSTRRGAVGIVDTHHWHEFVMVMWEGHEVEVMVSPTGRSVQVHVDGEKWEAPE